MKWRITRLLIPLLMLVFVLPMILPGSDGKPIMDLDDWLPNQQTVKKLLKESLKGVNNAASMISDEPVITTLKPTLYKWQDAQGRWQFTDDIKQVPADVLQTLKRQALPRVVNTMQPPVMPEAGERVESGRREVADPSLAKLPDLIDEAKKVRAQLEARNKAIESL